MTDAWGAGGTGGVGIFFSFPLPSRGLKCLKIRPVGANIRVKLTVCLLIHLALTSPSSSPLPPRLVKGVSKNTRAGREVQAKYDGLY